MPSVSARARSINASGIRRAFQLAAGLANPINLSIGVPAFDAPDPLKAGIKRALDEGKSGYTISAGIEPLREQIRDAHGPGDYKVIITAGTSGAFVLSYLALLDPGDEVLIPEPFFGSYRDVAKLLHAVPVYYDTYETAFRPSIDRLEPLVSERTKALVINTPANPTGVALRQAEVDELVAFARRHGLWLISDELYSLYTYDFEPATAHGRYEYTIVLSGFSKSHGIPGLRVGYALVPPELEPEFIKLQQYTYVCAPAAVQWGLAYAGPLDLSSIRDDYRKKRDFLSDALLGHLKFERPSGAFYLFAEAPGGNAEAFFQECVKHELIIVPGAAFSARDTHLRISFSAPGEVLERGADVLRSLAPHSHGRGG